MNKYKKISSIKFLPTDSTKKLDLLYNPRNLKPQT